MKKLKIYVINKTSTKCKGKIPLENSKTHKNKFERGNSDVFEIKEADVGEIRKIKIGHDGKRPGAGF